MARTELDTFPFSGHYSDRVLTHMPRTSKQLDRIDPSISRRANRSARFSGRAPLGEEVGSRSVELTEDRTMPSSPLTSAKIETSSSTVLPNVALMRPCEVQDEGGGQSRDLDGAIAEWPGGVQSRAISIDVHRGYLRPVERGCQRAVRRAR